MKQAGLYKLDKKVAETNFAILYEGRRFNQTGELDEFRYAIKEFKDIDSLVDYPNKEKEISQRIYNRSKECVNIPITEVFAHDGAKYGVMEYRKNGVFLSDFIVALEKEYGPGNIPFKLQYRIIKRLLKALDSLHNIYDRDTEKKVGGYLHMDLQPANIFIENAGTYKLSMGSPKFIDFQSALEIGEDGFAVREDDENAFATVGYACPELNNVNNKRFTVAADIYSIGAIAARMYTGMDMSLDYISYEDMLSDSVCNDVVGVYGSVIVRNMYKSVIDVALSIKPSYRYDSANQMFESLNRVKQCYDCVVNNDYYGLLKLCYVMSVSKSSLRNLDMDKSAFAKVVKVLKDNTYSMDVQSIMGIYMFDVLGAIWDINHETKGYSTSSYNDLMSCGIAYNNHLGRYDRAIEIYERIDKNSLSVDEYIKLSNRIIVSYADRLEYKKARNICSQIISFLEQRKKLDMKAAEAMGLNPGMASRNVDLARAYSGMGYYTTLCGEDNGLEYFEKALGEFGDDPGNRDITLSRMLQCYIYKKDSNGSYEEYLKGYLYEKPVDAFVANYYDKSGQVLEQDVSIKINDMFKFLVYLKDLYTFNMDKVNDELLDKLSFIVEQHQTLDKSTRVHPLELIYKYIGLIIGEYKADMGGDDVYRAMKLAAMCIDGDSFMRSSSLNLNSLISYCIMWEQRKLLNDDCEDIYRDLLRKAKRSGWNNLVGKLEANKDLSKLCPYEAR